MKTWSLTEIEVRAIDKHGDAIDILGHFATVREARKCVPKIEGETAALVIERHTSYGACSGKPDRYKMIDCFGDMSALYEGGWMPREDES